MIKHIVMFRLASEASGCTKEENLKTALDMLKGFRGNIPTLQEFHYVTNLEGTPENNWDLSLFCTFETVEDMKLYKAHPVHQAYSKFITSVRESRACIDYEEDDLL